MKRNEYILLSIVLILALLCLQQSRLKKANKPAIATPQATTLVQAREVKKDKRPVYVMVLLSSLGFAKYIVGFYFFRSKKAQKKVKELIVRMIEKSATVKELFKRMLASSRKFNDFLKEAIENHP